MSRLGTLFRAAAPYALGTAAGAGTYAATKSPEEAAVAALLAGTLGSRSTIHGLRGGEPGAATRALNKGNLAASPHWERSGTGFKTEVFDPLTKSRRTFDVDPANPTSMTSTKLKLEGLGAQTTQDTVLKDIIARKGGLAALVGGGSLLMNLGKATRNIEGITGDVRKETPEVMANLKGTSANLKGLIGNLKDVASDTKAAQLPGEIKTTLQGVGSVGEGLKAVGAGQGRLADVAEKALPYLGGAAAVGGVGLLAYLLKKRKANARQSARY